MFSQSLFLLQVNCCSAEGFFPGGHDDNRFSSSKTNYNEALRSTSHVSPPGLHPSSSLEISRKRRNKPLAVAVGFKCANDYNGRPIVITPGRKSPNSVLTRSMDPFQAARQGNGNRSAPQLPVLTPSCNGYGMANPTPMAQRN